MKFWLEFSLASKWWLSLVLKPLPTPSIKQAVVYTPYYVDKALADGREIGLPITLEHFSDATMETAHKRPKKGNFLFSGGRDGPTDVVEYQTCVLTQVFQNEIYHIWDKGNQLKSKRHKPTESDESETQDVKRRKVQLPFDNEFDDDSCDLVNFDQNNAGPSELDDQLLSNPMNEADEDDVVALPIGPDEMACLANTVGFETEGQINVFEKVRCETNKLLFSAISKSSHQNA
ncbi:Hypothetical predicted protein [Paramuricea clavata]|uniref:Uncharacterized protein n=1 Tax=Paramuricea clavata TaxID=317549 RepID=A0A6S7GE08_PARCT|nr:Hypothetical predicted protein [Paramuricea clavata]